MCRRHDVVGTLATVTRLVSDIREHLPGDGDPATDPLLDRLDALDAVLDNLHSYLFHTAA